MSLITKDQLSSSIDLVKNLISFKADKNDLNDLSDKVEEVQGSSFNRITFSKDIKTSIPPSADIFNVGSTLEFKNEYTNEEFVQIINQHSSNTDPLMLMANDSMAFGIIDSTLVEGPWASPGIYDLLIMIGDTMYSYSVPDQCWYCSDTYPEKLSVMSITIENNNFQFPCGEEVVLSLLAGKESTETQTVTIDAVNTDKTLSLKIGEGIDLNTDNNTVSIESKAFNKVKFERRKKIVVEDIFSPGKTVTFRNDYTANELEKLFEKWANSSEFTDNFIHCITNDYELYAYGWRPYSGNCYALTINYHTFNDNVWVGYTFGYPDANGVQQLNWCKLYNYSSIEESNLDPFSFTLPGSSNEYTLTLCSDIEWVLSLFPRNETTEEVVIDPANTGMVLRLKAGEGVELNSENNELIIGSNTSTFNKASILIEKTFDEYFQPGNLISFKESYDQDTLRAIDNYMPGYDVIELCEYTKDENHLLIEPYVRNYDGRYGVCVAVRRGYYETIYEYYYYGFVDQSGNQHLNWCRLDDDDNIIEENLPPPSFVATDNFSYYRYENQGLAETLFPLKIYNSLSASDLDKDLVLIPGEGINLTVQENGILIEGSAKIEIDDELSDTSANPVQNQVITNELGIISNELENIKSLIDTKIEAALSTLAKAEEANW
jgi:hypothetical protein